MANGSDTGELYASFMREIRGRLDDVHNRVRSIKAAPDAPSSIFDAELCILHIRFVCELIALGSLAAHHSIGLNKDLLKAWHANEIFEDLERINEHCFPVPITAQLDDRGLTQFVRAPDRMMTRHELRDIYGQCGGLLHRGVLKHALKGKNRTYEVPRISEWKARLMILLAEHMILLPSELRVLIVNVAGDHEGRVIVIHGAADGPFAVSSNDH